MSSSERENRMWFVNRPCFWCCSGAVPGPRVLRTVCNTLPWTSRPFLSGGDGFEVKILRSGISSLSPRGCVAPETDPAPRRWAWFRWRLFPTIRRVSGPERASRSSSQNVFTEAVYRFKQFIGLMCNFRFLCGRDLFFSHESTSVCEGVECSHA